MTNCFVQRMNICLLIYYRYLIGEHISPVFHVYFSKNDFCIIYQQADCNLAFFLERNKNKLNTAERISLMLELSKSVAKLHNIGIAHGNLLPSRIYVTKDKHISMIGYDDPKTLELSFSTFIHNVYLPPAAASSNKVIYDNDIYALGVLIYEIWTTSKVSTPKLDFDLLKAIETPPQLQLLIYRCVNTDNQTRCTAAEICDMLQSIQV